MTYAIGCLSAYEVLDRHRRDGSLHDHIVKQWLFVRSYVNKGGRLFVALMADGGTFEFEPMP